MSVPALSVIVCTRNRVGDIGACIETILRNPGDGFDLTVVDQSDDRATEKALAAFRDPRLRYIRSETRGLSAARNVGIGSTHAPIVAFTDDDCRVPDNWVVLWHQLFSDDAEAALAFGRVVLPEELQGSGHAATFDPTQRQYQHSFPDPEAPWGIGANMAFRRRVFDQVGTFDPFLGAGAKFPAGEETDLTIRVIAAGEKVLHVKEIAVVHLGVRHGADASKLMRAYGVGLGAAFAKHVRLRTKDSAGLLARFVAHHGSRSLQNAVRASRPTGLGFVYGVVVGACRSFEQGVDRARFAYRHR